MFKKLSAMLHSLVLLLIAAPLLSDSFPNHDYNSVLTVTRLVYKEFKCNCIVILKTSAPGTAQFSDLERLAHDIAQKSDTRWPIQVALSDFPEYSKKLLNEQSQVSGTCFKSLNIVILGEKTRDDFIKLSQTFKFTRSIWFLFMNETEQSTFFNDVNLTFNAGIYVVSPPTDEKIEVSEVYRVDSAYPVRMGHIAHWSPRHGYRGNKDPRYKRRGDLEGLTLRAGCLEAWPMSSFVEGKAGKVRELDGFFADVWYQLQEKLNFTTKFFKAIDNTAGSPDMDGNWSGLLGMLQRGEIDVILSQLDYSPKRLAVAQHLLPILNSRFQVYFQPKGYLLDWMALFRPFSLLVWLAILLWIIAAAITMATFKKICEHYGLPEHPDYDYSYTFFFVLQSISFQGSHKAPKVWACRVVFFLCYLTAAILIPSYSAALISSLTKKTPIRPFENFEGMLNVNNYYVLIFGGSTKEYLTEEGGANGRLYNNVYQKLVKPVEHYAMAPIEHLRYVCKHNNFAFFGSEAWADYNIHTGKCCQLVKFQQPLTKLHQSLALAKDSPLTDAFNFNIHQMLESGLIKRERNKFFPRWDSLEPEIVPAVTIGDSMEAFLFIVTCFGLSLLILMFEVLYCKFETRKKQQRNNLNQQQRWFDYKQ